MLYDSAVLKSAYSARRLTGHEYQFVLAEKRKTPGLLSPRVDIIAFNPD
jgi:hypothetical protein